VRRKPIAKGSTKKKQYAAPIIKNVVVITTKGTTYFFSLCKRPGEIKCQSWEKMTGRDITMPVMIEIFMCIQKASAGARKIREGLFFIFFCIN
jgi:hypothetical protein